MSESEAVHRVMDGSAWDAFCEHLKRAGRGVIEAAPDDPFDRAEGLRYVGRIASYGLLSFIEQSDPSAPVIGGLPKLGGDNPDYVYSSAALSGRFEYRLRGTPGDASYLGIGSYHGGVGTPEGLRTSGYLSGDELQTASDGSFEITLSVEERSGNWLPMVPETSQLMIRELLLDRRQQRPGRFEIERIGGDGAPGALDPLRYATQLDLAGSYVEGAIAQFLEWSASFATRPNQVLPLDPALLAAAQGDARTHYYSGYYDLGADEALVIDLQPPVCEYWNLQLCNHWLESLDYEKHRVHVNHDSAVRGPEGAVQMVVALRDPGVPNWLDSAGHQRGGMFMRQVGTDTPSDPVCRVMGLGELR